MHVASLPLNEIEPFLSIDDSLLEDLEPRLFAPPTRLSELLGRQNTALLQELARLVVKLNVGSPGPAIVVSANPLRVVCYGAQIDKCILLEFAERPPCAARLEVGARLLCINEYDDVPAGDAMGEKGPQSWRNFAPLIAEFVSSEAYRIAELHHQIPDEHWERCEALAPKFAEHGVLPRDGRPSKCGFPAGRSA